MPNCGIQIMSRNFANPGSLDYLFLNYICTKLTLRCDIYTMTLIHLYIHTLFKGAFSQLSASLEPERLFFPEC
jgi:hypothetical protein